MLHLVNALKLVSDDIVHVHPEHDDALPQHGDHVERVEEVVEDLLRLVLNVVNAVLLDHLIIININIIIIITLMRFWYLVVYCLYCSVSVVIERLSLILVMKDWL